MVWLTPANRFMQLQLPAFRILEDWANQLPEIQIIRNCAHEFNLQMDEARGFVMEVTGQLKSLACNYIQDNIVRLGDETIPVSEGKWFTTKYYGIHGKNFRFRYSDPDLEKLIHPGFAYLELKLPEPKVHHSFDLFYNGDQAIMQTEGQNTWKCAHSKPEYFVGSVFMQMLNCINNSTDAHWMGTVHASAVSAGNGAILFTAPSGSGKSTFAAMLMDQGYPVLSDDFSPISLNPAKVYPFPEGISVKNRSLEVLQPYFPSLAESGNSLTPDVREVFLPLTTGELPAAAPVKAIVFLQYDPSVEVEFKQISNLQSMGRFLQQLWLPPTTEVASSFMDWYFHIPSYTLHYSDNAKAIKSLSGLLLL